MNGSYVPIGASQDAIFSVYIGEIRLSESVCQGGKVPTDSKEKFLL
jgi:hypothetical protein